MPEDRHYLCLPINLIDVTENIAPFVGEGAYATMGNPSDASTDNLKVKVWKVSINTMNQHTEEGSSAARGTGVSYTEWARVSEPTSYPTNTVYTTYNEVSTKSNEYASSLVARADW